MTITPVNFVQASLSQSVPVHHMSEQDDEKAMGVLVATGGNHPVLTTIYDLHDDLLRLSHALLGVGHFQYSPLACKMLLRASEQQPGYRKITTAGIHACTKAAQYRQLYALQWLRYNGCDWDKDSCNAAAGGGHLVILQWARQNGCSWYSGTCQKAAKGGGHLSILQWVRENRCPWWNKHTCQKATKGGHLSILQWARETRCLWDNGTCAAAAAPGGHLIIIQGARKR